MPSLRRHEGFVLRDDRVSGGTLFESATVTCAHCQTVVVLNPDRQRPRGYCAKCDHYICDNPICNNGCYPIKQRFDDIERTILRQEALARNHIQLPTGDPHGIVVSNPE